MPVIPRREEELARPRSRKGKDQQPVKRGVMRTAMVPEPDENWHPVATRLYLSALDSGQRDFYQSSDIALLWSLCDDLSDFKKAGRRSAQMAAVIYTALSKLLLTEGDRRIARIELTEPTPEGPSAEVVAIASIQDRLSQPARRSARTSS